VVAPWSAPDVAPAAGESRPAVADAVATDARPTAPSRAPLVTHPLTRFDIVDRALDIIKAAPRAVLGATALFLVPFEVVSVLLRRNQLDLDTIDEVVTSSLVAAIALRLIALSFVTFAVAHLVWAWQRGQAPTAVEAASAALRRSPTILAAWLLVHLCELGAALAFAVPLLFVGPLLFATIPVIAVEGCGAFAGMRRSWRLAAKEVALALGAVVVIAVAALVLTIGLSGLVAVSDTIFDAFDIGGAWVVAVAISLATALVVLPFVGAAATLFYLDLRVRREGLDIELAADRHFDAVG
jgi:hypothetical protein